MSQLDRTRAGGLAGRALSALDADYPHTPRGRWLDAGDVREPARAHPAFHGGGGWVGAVRSLWVLARILARAEAHAGGAADRARELLERRLTADAVTTETTWLERDPDRGRPDGWAWLLTLATELAGIHPPVADALAPLAGLAADRAAAWLRDPTPVPDRSGTGTTSAFALVLVHRHATASGDASLAECGVSAARRWFLRDTDAPAGFEPSAGSVVSPLLSEAHAMSRVLGRGAFEAWYEAFLPGSGRVLPGALREPPSGPGDGPPTGWRLVLTLTRAFSWRAVARALPARDERRVAALDAADGHLAAALPALDAPAGPGRVAPAALLALDGL